MIIEAITITDSGSYEWPWSYSGFIVIKGGSGGDGEIGVDRASGGKEGQATSVVIENETTLAARGGIGGNGLLVSPDRAENKRQEQGEWVGGKGEVRTIGVSLPVNAKIQVRIGKGGRGGGRDGADGEVLLIPTFGEAHPSR